MKIDLGGRSPGLQWLILLVLSALFFLILHTMHLPAALLLGPMAAAATIAILNGVIRLPLRPFVFAQGIVGCLIARSIDLDTIYEIGHDWPIFLLVMVSVIVVSNTLGWLLARLQILPGTTAVWGSAPGAATAMVLMSEAYGADIRLVALMQYLRVLFVAVVASIVAKVWATGPVAVASEMIWFPAIAWLDFAKTLAVIGLGSWVAVRLRIPGGPMLVPMFAAVLLHNTGLMTIVLPPWFLAASYMFIGWNVGARFTRAVLIYAMRMLPGSSPRSSL